MDADKEEPGKVPTCAAELQAPCTRAGALGPARSHPAVWAPGHLDSDSHRTLPLWDGAQGVTLRGEAYLFGLAFHALDSKGRPVRTVETPQPVW